MGGASKEGHSGFGLFVLKTLTSAIMLIRLERLAINVIKHYDFFYFPKEFFQCQKKIRYFCPNSSTWQIVFGCLSLLHILTIF